MGLDARVYCNCFERGRLRTPPRADFDVYVDEQGSLECRNSDPDTQCEFDAWRANHACEHESVTLLHHRIGNISLVGLLRAELNRQPDEFPIILNKVVYSGSHCCDFLTVDQVRVLRNELPALKLFRCSNTHAQALMDDFYVQISELVQCALDVNKPIVF